MSEPKSNAEYDWNSFDPAVYQDRNYGFVRPEDRQLMELTAAAFAGEDSNLEVVDVGTGSNIYPLLAVLPRSKTVTCWEYGSANVSWLSSALHSPLDRVWQKFWEVARQVYAPETLVTDPSHMLSAKASVEQGSIFALPPRKWDAATMFFCAESITEQQEEFDRAMIAWTRAVRSGGRLAAAFMENSQGYDVAGLELPAFPLTADRLHSAMAEIAYDIRIERIEIQRNIRHGYSGMLFLSARSR